jgi:hypothetical protein
MTTRLKKQTLKPKLGPFSGQIRTFGYVGAFVAELAALNELAQREQRGHAASPVLRAVMRPTEHVPGSWGPAPLPEEDFALISGAFCAHVFHPPLGFNI